MKLKVRRRRKSKTATLSRKLQGEFIRFLEYGPVSSVSRNLRRMVLEYLMQDGVVGSIYLHETLSDLHRLFELLDAAEAEWETE